MHSKKGGRLFKLVASICVGGCAVMLYLGYYFFKDRTTAFVLFNGYIILLTGLVIYMAHRFIKSYITD
jgi:predicted membrane channel-forming protein YqfA (hemolysin III family)